MIRITLYFFRFNQFWPMKNKAVKLILVCLLCLGLAAAIAWLVQSAFHH